jgi:hypothetical protein
MTGGLVINVVPVQAFMAYLNEAFHPQTLGVDLVSLELRQSCGSFNPVPVLFL